MTNKRKTIIQPELFRNADKIYEDIKYNSPQSANKFKYELLKQIDKVEKYPEAYTPENFLNKKRIIYRYIIVMKSWKLIFKVTKELIVFLSIVHTRQHPDNIQKLQTNKYNI